MKDVHNFELFGYEDTEECWEDLLILRETTVVLDAKTARALGHFFFSCADGMEQLPSWEHEHFNSNGDVDLVVVSSEYVKKKKREQDGKN